MFNGLPRNEEDSLVWRAGVTSKSFFAVENTSSVLFDILLRFSHYSNTNASTQNTSITNSVHETSFRFPAKTFTTVQLKNPQMIP